MKKSTLGFLVVALGIGMIIGYFLFRDNTGRQHEYTKEIAGDTLWTCSMHPQILQSEPGNCPICGMELIPVQSANQDLFPNQFSLSERALALADIRTLKVGFAGEASESLQLSGRIRENEEANSVQASYFDGRIEQLFINTTGESVSKGQKLASIYAPELVAAQQELLTAASLRTKQPELYRAVRNKLTYWKLTENQIDAIEKSGKIMENFPVYATVSGTVTDKIVQEGDYVKQGQPLFQIANLNTVWAVFDAYEQQIQQLGEGQKVTISTKAYPSRNFEGKINFINPVLNTRNRTVEVRSVLDNRSGLFKPGMFVTGSVAISPATGESPLMIPSSAVMWTGERSVVYVKPQPSQPVFEMREVVLGSQASGMEQVIEGLSEGEEIVVEGTFTVDAAAQLEGKKSMMNRSGGRAITSHEGHTDVQAGQTSQRETAVQQDASNLGSLTKLLPGYLELKDNLVEGNTKDISESAAALINSLEMLLASHSLRSEEAHLKKVGEVLKSMATSKDLEDQRQHFVTLNEHLVPVFKKVGHFGNKLYVQYCPMANNVKGAFWLSKDREIRNPYYGAQMLSCGSITDSL